MEREANYVAVGAFILLVVGMAVAFIIWYTDSSDGVHYTTYEISFAGNAPGKADLIGRIVHSVTTVRVPDKERKRHADHQQDEGTDGDVVGFALHDASASL